MELVLRVKTTVGIISYNIKNIQEIEKHFSFTREEKSTVFNERSSTTILNRLVVIICAEYLPSNNSILCIPAFQMFDNNH